MSLYEQLINDLWAPHAYRRVTRQHLREVQDLLYEGLITLTPIVPGAAIVRLHENVRDQHTGHRTLMATLPTQHAPGCDPADSWPVPCDCGAADGSY